MGFREERIAENEAVVREINEMILQAHESAPDISFMHIVCECGYEECGSIIALTKDEYERIRNDPRQFCVIEEHVIQDVEAIVEDNDRFAIVAKRQGAPAEIAIRTDPRARPLLPPISASNPNTTARAALSSSRSISSY
jgi:hypothetical protein